MKTIRQKSKLCYFLLVIEKFRDTPLKYSEAVRRNRTESGKFEGLSDKLIDNVEKSALLANYGH